MGRRPWIQPFSTWAFNQ
jgi:hypothetical protein